LTIAVDVEPSYHALAWKAFQMGQEGHSHRKAGCGFLKVRTYAIHPHIQL
jgi:hypothetical protein